MAFEYGGWYWRPELGRAQRWFDGVWTDGEEPQQQNNVSSQFQAQLSAFDSATNRYIDDLISQAQGDRDFAVSILTKDHESALGTDDQERAAFLESVADNLEQKIGRIPYDYQVGSRRLEEDATLQTERTTQARDRALARLAEDEQVFRQNFSRESEAAKQGQSEDLSRRGLLTGTRDSATGVAARDVGELNTDIATQLSAFERELGRNREDVNQVASDNLFDINRAKTRGAEDLTTDARRAALDTDRAYTTGLEAENKRLEARKKELEKQRKLSGLSNLSFAGANL